MDVDLSRAAILEVISPRIAAVTSITHAPCIWRALTPDSPWIHSNDQDSKSCTPPVRQDGRTDIVYCSAPAPMAAMVELAHMPPHGEPGATGGGHFSIGGTVAIRPAGLPLALSSSRRSINNADRRWA